VVLEVV
jgi:hypothetical protein